MTTPFTEQLADLHNQIGILELKRNATILIIEDLEAQGFLDGHPWYKNQKYLYLIHHADQAKEYIGADPEKQAEALARLERYAEWKAQKTERTRLQSKITEIKSLVARAWDLLIEETAHA